MKNSLRDRMRTLTVVGLALLMVFGTFGFAGSAAWAGEADYGAAGAASGGDWTREELLGYARGDEQLARAEYEKIMDVFGEQRPFSNIMKAEETHIELLLPLFEAYGLEAPEDVSGAHVVIPETLAEAFETGVQAEIHNIAMYEQFLKEDLPEDVEEAFEALMKASESHLKAFERGTDRPVQTAGSANGRLGENANAGNGEARGKAWGRDSETQGKAWGRDGEARGNGYGLADGNGSGNAYGLGGEGQQKAYGEQSGNGNRYGNGTGLENGRIRACTSR